MHNQARAFASLSADDCLDLAHLDQQTGGDIPLQQELLTLFAARSREVLDQIYALAGAPMQGGTPLRNSTSLRNLAHQLRGSALAIGAFEVAAAAETVEQAILAEAAAGAVLAALNGLAAAHAKALAAIEGHLRQLAAQALN